MANRHVVVLNQTLRPAPDAGEVRPRLGRLELGQLRDDLARHEVHADIVRVVDRGNGPRASTERGDENHRPELPHPVPAEDVLVLGPPAWALVPGPRS